VSGQDPFDTAVALHEAGRLAEAEALCRRIVASRPAHSDALLLLGVIRTQSGDPAQAQILLARSLGMAPDVPMGHFYHAMVLAALGRPAEALQSYRRTTELDPGFAEAHFNSGLLLLAANRVEEALAAFERCLRLSPELTEAACARAVSLSRLNRRAEALAELDGVLARQPGYTPAINLRSDLYCELGRHAEALADSERSLALDASQSAAHVSRCTALLALNRLPEAQTEIDCALVLDPNSAKALAMRAALHRSFGRLQEALADCDRAVALAPGDAPMYFNRGDTLLAMGQYDKALEALGRAAALNPHLAKTYHSRGLVLRHLRRFEEALADCERALALDPALGPVAGERFLLAGLLCDWRNRSAAADDLARRIREGQVVGPWIAVTSFDDPQLQLQAAKRLAEPAVAAAGRTPRHERLRIAYLSPDFHEHPTAHLLVELIERHDKARFETYGICLHGGPDSAIRTRIAAAFEHFVEAGARSDAEIADLLRSLEIDIAVDLAGHAGNARRWIFAHRPSPLAVNYVGYPGTLGSDWIDYVLADAVTIPPGSEEFFSEEVVRLPDCFFPSDTRPELAPPPSRAGAGLPQEGFVYCSFNNGYKITPEMFDIWMRLLLAVQGSVLWLLADNATMRRHLAAEAGARGVAAERLDFADRLPRAQHLARLSLADCFLDTLPCNAHTTASDALWMGVPLIACMGRSFAARVAGSMLTAIGLEELIAPDLAAYEALALELAHAPERLAALRARLARNRSSHPLFDMTRLARQVESAYETMWRRHSAGLPPAGFDVPPA
jgi:protein O-GlcNAc transferase